MGSESRIATEEFGRCVRALRRELADPPRRRSLRASFWRGYCWGAGLGLAGVLLVWLAQAWCR